MVETQLLLSSLSDSCLNGPLPTEDLANLAPRVIASGPRQAILVQIEAIFEVGESALSLKHVHNQRKEEERIKAKGGNVDKARIIDNVEDVADSKGPPKFPRSMLMLHVSDGFTTMKAMEYKHIPELSLEDTKLGSKLLLKDVRAHRGILLLQPSSIVLKGQYVSEMHDQADADFAETIRERLGLTGSPKNEEMHIDEPDQKPGLATNSTVNPDSLILPSNSTALEQKKEEDDDHKLAANGSEGYFDDDFDEEAFAELDRIAAVKSKISPAPPVDLDAASDSDSNVDLVFGKSKQAQGVIDISSSP